jgi:hypothetical protein
MNRKRQLLVELHELKIMVQENVAIVTQSQEVKKKEFQQWRRLLRNCTEKRGLGVMAYRVARKQLRMTYGAQMLSLIITMASITLLEMILDLNEMMQSPKNNTRYIAINSRRQAEQRMTPCRSKMQERNQRVSKYFGNVVKNRDNYKRIY